MNDGLRKRISTAVVLGGGFLAVVLLLPGIVTLVVLTLLILAGAWEWSAFLKLRSVGSRTLYVALVAAMLWLARMVADSPEGLEIVLAAAVVWWVIALVWIAFAPHRVTSLLAGLAGLLALVPAWVALVRLFALSPHWLLFTFLLVIAADIGAFFAGRRFGRLRLAPAVSPGKTWEGVLGGIAGGGILALCGSAWFAVPAYAFVPLCLAVVGFSIIGDLTESLLKRFAGLKDSGTLFPGHGGVMDRIDSVTGAAPVLLFGLTVMGVAA